MLEIRLAKPQDLDTVWKIYQKAKLNLEKKGIYQWTDSYPNKELIEDDINKQYLFVGVLSHQIIGAINISEEQEKEYAEIEWQIREGKILVVHRLVIEPSKQGKGLASQLMNYAEKYGTDNSYAAIRLDTYSQNTFNLNFYLNRTYQLRGKVRFPQREHHFWCLEKELL